MICAAPVYPGICGNPLPCHEHPVPHTDYENATYEQSKKAIKWIDGINAKQWAGLRGAGLLRSDEEVAAFDEWERNR